MNVIFILSLGKLLAFLTLLLGLRLLLIILMILRCIDNSLNFTLLDIDIVPSVIKMIDLI